MRGTRRAQELLSGSTLAVEHDVMDALAARIEKAGNQTAVAKETGVSNAYICDVMFGRRNMGPKLARGLGWEKITVYRKI